MSSAFGKPCSTNRNWTIIQFYCAALCVLLVTQGSYSAECYDSVTRCPCSKDLWNERAQNVSCEQPRNYACVLHASNILVEICTTNFTIFSGTPGCPYVKRCKGKEAEFGISSKYKECPEHIEGCPTKNHSEYSIYKLHLYPACFITNRTELKNGTFRNYCIKKQPVGASTEKSNSVWWIVILVLVILLIIGITIYIIIRIQNRVRRQGRDSERSKDKEKRNPLLTGIPKLKETLLALNESEVNNYKKLNPLVRSFMSPNDSSFFASVNLEDDVEYIVNGIRKDEDDSVRIPAKEINTPENIFEKEGKKHLRRIYLRGEAGRGKSTFCMRLLDYWCKAHSDSDDDIRSEERIWVNGIKKFDFAFLVRMKNVDESKSVIEMVCQDTDFGNDDDLYGYIRDVILDKNYRCLIILDGLDGWKPTNEVLKSLKTPGMPKIDDMPNTTLLFSSRTWKLDEISESFRDIDRMVNILGLDERGVKKIFENISCEHYKCKPQDLDEKYDIFRKKIPESFVSNPLLLTASVYLWYDTDQTFESKTDLFLSLVQFMIERYKTENPNKLPAVNRISQEVKMSFEVECILEKYKSLRSHMRDLIGLGKLAFNEVVLKDTHFVFEETALPEEIQFLEDVGIVSKTKKSPKFVTKMVRLSFLHENFQELLAGLYVVSGHPIGIAELASIKKILKLSYVITFISGLAPTKGAEISKDIAEIVDKDENVKIYRATVNYEKHHDIKTLYNLLVDCYREAEKSKMNASFTYWISDIYLRSDDDGSLMHVPKKLSEVKGVRSLYLRFVPRDEKGISDLCLNQFLCDNPQLETFYVKGDRSFDRSNIFNIDQKRALLLDNVTVTTDTLGNINRAQQLETLGLWNVTFHNLSESPSSMKDLLLALPLLPNLSTLYISCKTYKEDRENIIKTLPGLEHLKIIQYGGVSSEKEIFDNCDNDTDKRVVKAILESRANTLKRFHLDYVKLDIDSLEQIKNMKCLEKVVLRHVHMEEDAWKKVIGNIENIQRRFSTTLVKTNVPETVKFKVENSDQFKLNSDSTLHYAKSDTFSFSRVLN